MSSLQEASRLMEIAGDVEKAANLVRLGWMATSVLGEDEAAPIAEVLDLVADRLKQVERDALCAAGDVAAWSKPSAA